MGETGKGEKGSQRKEELWRGEYRTRRNGGKYRKGNRDGEERGKRTEGGEGESPPPQLRERGEM